MRPVPPARAAQQVVRQHRRDRQRDEQRGHDAGDVGNAQRRENAAFHAVEGKERQKHQHHDDGGVHDGVAHFRRGCVDNLQGRPGRGQPLVFAQPPKHVFHVHNRVVHQLADGDGQPAERHGVEADAGGPKHQGRHEQRQRNGG